MYGYIYKTTNLVTNKIYIGQKKSKYFLRNAYLGSGKKLLLAVESYGKENFEVELLEEVEHKEEMDAREIYWISLYHATDDTIGYNISEGGNVNRTMRGKNHPMYGRDRSGEKNPAFGKHWWTNGSEQCYSETCPEGWWAGVSDEVRLHHSLSQKGCQEVWNKGKTKKDDPRLNGNHHPRTSEFKQSLSEQLSGENNPMFGKMGNQKFKYYYDGKEFIGAPQLVTYMREHGYPTFTGNHLTTLVKGKHSRTFPQLEGLISCKEEKQIGSITSDN